MYFKKYCSKVKKVQQSIVHYVASFLVYLETTDCNVFIFCYLIKPKNYSLIDVIMDYICIVSPVLILQNQYIGGTKDVAVATIYRTCFDPSELKLCNLKN
ncbi:hypothetical protein BpHYR1_031152 [Brachionus plicatilis]|uniref:Uncharacterized protein n=1 Tax=Brachionus plicatilis TaxID=10195 RepID=A0A3M7SDH2_BRAPC|nr:hypothetical protein BpHYR1_031152 [Brachionus plicatilis]